MAPQQQQLPQPANAQGGVARVCLNGLQASGVPIIDDAWYDGDTDRAGVWGGVCTCPSGKQYNVGDNLDNCGSFWRIAVLVFRRLGLHLQFFRSNVGDYHDRLDGAY